MQQNRYVYNSFNTCTCLQPHTCLILYECNHMPNNYTVDREIFMCKNFRAIDFHVLIFVVSLGMQIHVVHID